MLRLGFSLPCPTVSGCSLGLPFVDSTQCVASRSRRSRTKDGASARARRVPSARSVLSMERRMAEGRGRGSEDDEYDAIVIGSGIGGLVAATQLAVKGARVLVLEKYVIPGGSSGSYERDGFTFDVGSSVMFGFGDKGNVNMITRALQAVDCKMQVIPDPSTVHYHLPGDLSVCVHREYSEFIAELTSKFPHEKKGILRFYGECWKVFNALNSLELKSLEEPLYLFGQFFKKPLECLTLGNDWPFLSVKRKRIKHYKEFTFGYITNSIVFLFGYGYNYDMFVCSYV